MWIFYSQKLSFSVYLLGNEDSCCVFRDIFPGTDFKTWLKFALKSHYGNDSKTKNRYIFFLSSVESKYWPRRDTFVCEINLFRGNLRPSHLWYDSARQYLHILFCGVGWKSLANFRIIVELLFGSAEAQYDSVISIFLYLLRNTSLDWIAWHERSDTLSFSIIFVIFKRLSLIAGSIN